MLASSKKRDLWVISAWPIAASLLSLALKAGLLGSMALFLAAPVVYLSFRYPLFIKKSALFALLTSIPVGIIADHVMEQTGGWRTYSIFGSFRIFDYVVVDQIVWLFFYVYFIGMFYEVFLDVSDGEIRYSGMKPLAVFVSAILALFLLAHYFQPSLLIINYFYLKFGLFSAVIPLFAILSRIPKIYRRLLRAGAYFFILSFIYELTALYLGQWSFPAESQFIGIINVFGLRFPVEELLFWMIFGGIATAAYYEFFADDRK